MQDETFRCFGRGVPMAHNVSAIIESVPRGDVGIAPYDFLRQCNPWRRGRCPQRPAGTDLHHCTKSPFQGGYVGCMQARSLAAPRYHHTGEDGLSPALALPKTMAPTTGCETAASTARCGGSLRRLVLFCKNNRAGAPAPTRSVNSYFCFYPN